MLRGKALVARPRGEVRQRRHDVSILPTVGKAVDRALAGWPAEAPFTATALAEHVSRRYGEILRRPVEARVVASALRRRRNDGILEEIREGRPFQEALYRKRG
jgi:hypothetical protein